MGKTAVGLYENTSEARAVLNELIDAGFSRGDIRIMLGDQSTRQMYEWFDDDASRNRGGPSWSESEAITTLVNSGVPRSDAQYYQEALNRGHALVSARTTDQRINEAVEIMSNHNIIDLQDRIQNWQQTGWTGAGQTSIQTGTTQRGATRSLESGEEETIPVVEEELRVGKRAVEHGGVRVRAHVTETPVDETVNLREEHVSVERRPANRPVGAADVGAFTDETIEVTETSEEAVIDKQARVVEEVVVRKDVDTRQETVHDTVRRTDVDVEQMGAGTLSWDRFNNDFRTHYNSNYANSGLAYSAYEPAYRYGYDLGTRADLRGRSWSQIEADARSRWDADRYGPWDRFKDAVQHAWMRVTR